MEDNLQSMKNLVEKLNNASRAYYQEDIEIISNLEYDKLYDELLELEKSTGITLSNSPSINVGYEILSELPKEKHASLMLSLDKTKDTLQLKEWLKDKEGFLSWKLDGLTIVLTYKDGKLVKAVTRGNGEVGEVITNNAKVFSNVPLNINYKGELVLRGEAVIKYSDFNKINELIEDIDAKYKNPRNLCSGSVRQLNNEITSKRNVNFFAFTLVKADGVDFDDKVENQLKWLRNEGFDVVSGRLVDSLNIEESVQYFAKEIVNNDFPSDGLVLIYNDIDYGKSLGKTAKFPRDSIAFKWRDEIKETVLRQIEWSASRTGLINPVAIFDPVELEGTTVTRASVHNVSILEALELGINDTITVYKANMIIPQIAENETRSGNLEIPSICPVCGGNTEIMQEHGVKTLYCTNEECLAKKIKSFTHFVSRDAMNIDGLSEATIEKLIAKGLITELADIFHVEKYKDEIVKMEGFGEKSYLNLVNSVNSARKTNLAKFLYSLGIPSIGLSNAKLICKEYNNNLEDILNAKAEDFIEIQGVGDIIAQTFKEFFDKKANMQIVEDVLKEIELVEEANEEVQNFVGINFVITGSLEKFTNRNEVKELIEKKGGKVTGSVTSKTNYLINNDNTSNSSKNKKAKELGVKIITEEEFFNMI